MVLTDTAGIRESEDLIEQEGMSRAREEIKNSNTVLVIMDI